MKNNFIKGSIVLITLVILGVILSMGCVDSTDTDNGIDEGAITDTNPDAGTDTDTNTETDNDTDPETDAETQNEMSTAMETTMATSTDSEIENSDLIRFTENDNGETIDIEEGERFILALQEQPTTGFRWDLRTSGGITQLDDEFVIDDQDEDSMSGTHYWTFEASEAGTQEIDGIYKQPWEKTTGEEDTFKITLEVSQSQ